nr:aminotransferase class IV family protein [Citreicella sp. C3M06]
MLWLPHSGIVRERLHLARCQRSCAVLGFDYDPVAVLRALNKIGGDAPLRLRMSVAQDGSVAMTSQPFELGALPVLSRVLVSAQRLDPRDPFLRLKTTRRALYDDAYASRPAGIDEVLFFNTQDELCEGSISNVFLQINGQKLTPAVSSGLLPGVLRESLLCTGEVKEEILTRHDLERAEKLWIGNSLRGLMPAVLA